MKRSRGFTLIEIVIFMAVLSIVGIMMMMGMNISLKGSPDMTKQTQAIMLAQQRMEVIMGQRLFFGFAALADPCGAGPFPDILCGEGAYANGYTISSTITPSWSGNPDLTLVVVNVTGPASATFTSLAANHQ